MARAVRREVATFLIITFLLSAIPYAWFIWSGTLRAAGFLVMLGFMWCPGIAAVITCLVHRRSLRGLGWSWGQTRYQALSFVTPIAYSLVAYACVWLLGLGRIRTIVTPGQPWKVVVIVVLIELLGCVYALGEEIGWRGFLVPRLAELGGFTRASLISGALWALWHYPLILFADYRASGVPVWYSLLCFTLMITGTNFAFNWLRLKSGSVWTAMFMHANHNNAIQVFLDPLTGDTGVTKFIVGESGVALAIAGMLTGFVFWRMRSRLPDLRLARG